MNGNKADQAGKTTLATWGTLTAEARVTLILAVLTIGVLWIVYRVGDEINATIKATADHQNALLEARNAIQLAHDKQAMAFIEAIKESSENGAEATQLLVDMVAKDLAEK